MKRYFSLSFITILATLGIIASCTPTNDDDPTGTYTCHCLITTASGTTPVDQVYSNVTLSYATTTCSTQEANYNTSGTTATCTLQK